MSPRTFQPGSAYKGGKLYLFSGHELLVVRAWPRPMAWRLGLDGPWRGARPLRLELDAPERWAALPEDHTLREYHLRQLRNQAAAFEPIPRAQRLEAVRYAERAWCMHVLFSRVPGALDLARVNPALAVGLAFHSSLRPRVARPLRSARTLLAQPGPRTAQRVAGWLGFDPSRTVVRTLRKLSHAQCTPWKLELLQRALAQLDTHKLLCHVPVLNGSIFQLLELLLDPAVPVVNANALALELSALGPEPARGTESLISETSYAWAAAFPDKPMPPLRSLAQLEQLHIDASVQLGAPLYHWGGQRQLLPPPPVVGIDTPTACIQPLGSPALQREEGRSMGHCVGNESYILRAARGAGYGYSVRLTVGDEEQRATAWVVYELDRTVRVRSLRGRLNHHPAPEVAVAVQAWIDAHNQAAREGRLPPLEGGLVHPPSLGDTRWARNWRRFGMLMGPQDAELIVANDMPYDDMPF
jgi:hypothetical protein